MSTDTYGQNRRTFLKSGFRLAGALLAGEAHSWLSPQGTFAAVPPPSRLVISRDPGLRSTPTGLDSSRLVNCLDRAMQALHDCDSPLEAWRKVVRPGEVVGLKVNCLAGRGNSTRPELVNAICERLQQAGIKEIVIWDRLNSDLESAHFKIVERGSGIRCFGNDVLGFEEELAVFGSAGSLVAKTLTQVCDAVINLPVLKDHGIAGVTITLKSMFGAIHNPNKYHMNVGNPYVADVYMLPPIRHKVRLHICDATTAQYEGGPSFMPHWTWPYNGLLVGRDPVALDYTGWQIIEKKRAEVGMKSLQEVKREPAYIRTAADPQHNLGNNDPRFIKVVEV
jgi:uncharacterized protein (DUF362 family)